MKPQFLHERKMSQHILLFVDLSRKGDCDSDVILESLREIGIKSKDVEFHNICENKYYVKFNNLTDSEFEDVQQNIKTPYDKVPYPQSLKHYGVHIPSDW